MYLYKKADIRNIQALTKQLLKASGIQTESSHCPHGLGAIVSFDFGDVYIDENTYLNLDNALKADIEQCLDNMRQDNFGIISDQEKETNVENKYLGCGKNLVGRYEVSVGIIELKVLKEYTKITLLNKKS